MALFSKERRKKRRAKRKETRKKIFKKIKEKGQKAKKKVALAPLVPFRPVMREMLKKRGFSAPMDLEKLAVSFYTNILKKKINTYEFSEGISEEYDYMKPENVLHPLNNQTGNFVEFDFNQYEVDGLEVNNLDPVTIGIIVTSITGILVAIINKRKEGKQLSESEREIADEIEANKEEIKELQESGDKEGGMFGGSNMILIIGIVVVAFFFLKK